MYLCLHYMTIYITRCKLQLATHNKQVATHNLSPMNGGILFPVLYQSLYRSEKQKALLVWEVHSFFTVTHLLGSLVLLVSQRQAFRIQTFNEFLSLLWAFQLFDRIFVSMIYDMFH